jgi:hypothetical protein
LIKDTVKVSIIERVGATRGGTGSGADGACAEERSPWWCREEVYRDVCFVQVGVGEAEGGRIRLEEEGKANWGGEVVDVAWRKGH